MALTSIRKRKPLLEDGPTTRQVKDYNFGTLPVTDLKTILGANNKSGVVEKTTAQPSYSFETKGLRGTSSSQSGDIDLADTAAQSLKYLVPGARLLNNDKAIKDLRTKSQLNLDKVRLYHGVVRDMPKPNFALRYREPEGSSLSELSNSQKFGDAQQREAERNYELQNATSRIQQQQNINQSMNQEQMVNTQITNAGKQYNANIANNERFMRMGNQEELELGLTETALNDNNQKNYLDATKKASAAADILRYGQPGTPEYQQAQQYYSDTLKTDGPPPSKKFGGRLKRKTKLSYAG